MYLNAIVGIAFFYRNEKTIDPFEKSYNVFKSCQKWSFCCHIQSKNNKITWDTNLTELEKLIHIFTKHIACHRRKCPLERSSKCCPRLSPNLQYLFLSTKNGITDLLSFSISWLNKHCAYFLSHSWFSRKWLCVCSARGMSIPAWTWAGQRAPVPVLTRFYYVIHGQVLWVALQLFAFSHCH